MLTVLTLMRGVRVAPVLDTEPIVRPPSGVVDKQWARFLPGFWASLRSLTRKVDAPVLWSKYHLGFKKGPGGRVALFESLDSLFSLPESLLTSIRTLGGKDLGERIDWLLSNRELIEDCHGPLRVIAPRRIHAIPDSEGKSRVIAMLDYFSQTALRPLHQYLFALLKVIPSDVTFAQGTFLDKVGG
jgi:hypothetical protein